MLCAWQNKWRAPGMKAQGKQRGIKLLRGMPGGLGPGTVSLDESKRTFSAVFTLRDKHFLDPSSHNFIRLGAADEPRTKTAASAPVSGLVLQEITPSGHQSHLYGQMGVSPARPGHASLGYRCAALQHDVMVMTGLVAGVINAGRE